MLLVKHIFKFNSLSRNTIICPKRACESMTSQLNVCHDAFHLIGCWSLHYTLASCLKYCSFLFVKHFLLNRKKKNLNWYKKINCLTFVIKYCKLTAAWFIPSGNWRRKPAASITSLKFFLSGLQIIRKITRPAAYTSTLFVCGSPLSWSCLKVLHTLKTLESVKKKTLNWVDFIKKQTCSGGAYGALPKWLLSSKWKI